MDALDDTFIFTDFMKEHGIPIPTATASTLFRVRCSSWPSGSPCSARGVLYGSGAAGVSIWDYATPPMSSRPSSSGPGAEAAARDRAARYDVHRRRLHDRPEQLSGKCKGSERIRVSTPRRSTIPRSARTRPSAPSPASVRVRVSARTCAAAISWRSRTPPSATARRSPT